MNNPKIIGSIGLILQAILMLFAAHYGYGLLAALIVIVPWVGLWWRGGREEQYLIDRLPELIVGLAAVVMITLTGTGGVRVLPLDLQLVVAAAFAVWTALSRWWDLPRTRPLVVAGVAQAFGTTAVFLISTFWHWPDSTIIALSWVVGVVVAYSYLRAKQERAATILAATWGLISAQAAWVFTVWLINYQIAGGAFAVPQATIVMVGLGYCVAGIYESHTSKRLSQRRLIEFLVIAGILLAIVVAGTRWLNQSLYN